MTPARRTAAVVALSGTTACIGWLDFVSGPELGLSLLYIAPIAVAGWTQGRVIGAVTAIQAAAWWVWADLRWHATYDELTTAWNAFTRLVIFATIGIGSAMMHADRKRLRELLAREQGLARTDALTSLPNSRAFREHANQDLARARREGSSVTLVYLDIDNFKHVNDRHGHARGDAFLADIAQAIRGCLRAGDHAARLGGDEFGVLLWGADSSAGEIVGQRLVTAIRALGDAFPGARVGASAGLATAPPTGATYEQLLQDADRAMYQVKQGAKGSVSALVRLQP
jgi:diguanylate cyclase (GGDEF)-like protein